MRQVGVTIRDVARAANVSVEALIDDRLDLPAKLPARRKSEGVRRAAAPRNNYSTKGKKV